MSRSARWIALIAFALLGPIAIYLVYWAVITVLGPPVFVAA